MEGFILSEHSFDHDDQLALRFWLKTQDGPTYIDFSKQEAVLFCRQSQINQLPSWLGYRHADLSLTHFDGSPISAVYCPNLKTLNTIRRYAKQNDIDLWEDDIKPTSRFLMERGVKGSLLASKQDTSQTETDPRIQPSHFNPDFSYLSFDIETTMPTRKVAEKLLSIAFVYEDSNQRKEMVYMLGNPNDSTEQLFFFKNVHSLLLASNHLINAWDPDLLLGWNVINFDVTVLHRLYSEHGIEMLWGRQQSPLNIRQGQNGYHFVDLPGRCILDGIDSLKNASYHFESFALDFVAQQLLDKGKVMDGFDGDMSDRGHAITDLFQHNKPALAQYNLNDCQLVIDIFKETQLIDYLVKRSFLTGHRLDRVGGSVAAFEFLYLPKLHRAGYIAPNLGEGFDGFKAPGGLVLDSKPGLYKDVLVLDFKSLYPSIIRTFKIDPMGLIEGLKAQKSGHSEDCIPGFHDAFFHREKHFLPDIITQLWSERDLAKKRNDAAQSYAIKIIMNSFYGILGSTGCRFFDARLASSITERGHKIINKSAQWIEDQGYEVIYGDTDSVFVSLHTGEANIANVDQSIAKQIGEQLSDGLNQYWQEKLKKEFHLDSHLEIEFENHYGDFLMPTIRGSEKGSKKRYAGLLSSGELVFKGLEAVRSDWTDLAKHIQKELYRAVFENKDYHVFIQTTVQELLQGRWDHALVYKKRIRKPLNHYKKNIPPQIQAAMAAEPIYQKKNQINPYENGGWIRYVITQQGPMALECADNLPLDYEHYIDKQIAPVVDSILYFLDERFEQIRSPQQDIFGQF